MPIPPRRGDRDGQGPVAIEALIRKTSLLRDRPDVPCGQAWNDKHRTPCSPQDVAVLQRALRLMLEIACTHEIFISPAHSERSPLHDVIQPARRIFRCDMRNDLLPDEPTKSVK